MWRLWNIDETKTKCPIVLNLHSERYYWKSKYFYPLEVFISTHFKMKHPVGFPYSCTPDCFCCNMTNKTSRPFDNQLSEACLMSGSSHIRSVLIVVEYWNYRQTLDVYLLFAIWRGPIQSNEWLMDWPVCKLQVCNLVLI